MERILRSFDATLLILHIMTASHMPKKVYMVQYIKSNQTQKVQYLSSYFIVIYFANLYILLGGVNYLYTRPSPVPNKTCRRYPELIKL